MDARASSFSAAGSPESALRTKLKHADADVVLIDKHDYHTFQPLLYQCATGLLETTAVGHSLRDLVHGQDNATIHQATRHRRRSRRARGAVRGPRSR